MFSTLLFTYGRLQPGYSPPKGAKHVGQDYVRGYMFERQDHAQKDPALVRPGDEKAPWVRGEVLRIPQRTLFDLDEGETGYERRLVKLKSGKEAWAYVWYGHVPSDAKMITAWDPKRARG